MDVFDLSATLSLDTQGYEQGLNGAAAAAKGIGGKIGSALKTATMVTGALVAAGAAVTGAFVSAAKKTADYGDKVDKMSQKKGISAYIDVSTCDYGKNEAEIFIKLPDGVSGVTVEEISAETAYFTVK